MPIASETPSPFAKIALRIDPSGMVFPMNFSGSGYRSRIVPFRSITLRVVPSGAFTFGYELIEPTEIQSCTKDGLEFGLSCQELDKRV